MAATTIPPSYINLIRLGHRVPSETTPYTFGECLDKWTLTLPAVPNITPVPRAVPARQVQESVFVLPSQTPAEPEAEQGGQDEEQVAPEPAPARQITEVMSWSAMLNSQKRPAQQYTLVSSQAMSNQQGQAAQQDTPPSSQSPTRSSSQVQPTTDNHDAGIPTPPSETSSWASSRPVQGYVWYSQYDGQRWTDRRLNE
jgi:hypothetical protein